MPEPDLTVRRTHLWRPAGIVEWHGSRPRPGVGGRPVSNHNTLIPTPAPSHERVPTQGGQQSGDSQWIVHGERRLYESPWIRVSMADLEWPDGRRDEHHTVWMPAAAMTALLNDAQTHVLLMWRHRFVPNIWNWELPGGLVDEGETPEQTAAREVEEETGYRARSLEHLVTFEPMIGMVTSPHHIYAGHDAEKMGEPIEKNEMQRMEWVPLTEIPCLIRDSLIKNSGTLVALLHVLAFSHLDGHPRSSTAD